MIKHENQIKSPFKSVLVCRVCKKPMKHSIKNQRSKHLSCPSSALNARDKSKNNID